MLTSGVIFASQNKRQLEGPLTTFRNQKYAKMSYMKNLKVVFSKTSVVNNISNLSSLYNLIWVHVYLCEMQRGGDDGDYIKQIID